MSAIDGFVIESKPVAHFGVDAIDQLPEVIRATGAGQVVVVTDDALASTPAIATVSAARSTWATPLRCPPPRYSTRRSPSACHRP
jgi:hypothetical protein